MNFQKLEKKLHVTFKNKNLLSQAFTHRSYINETPVELSSNERLEFLGDAVLTFIVSKNLYDSFPERPEGDLTSFRASIVKTAFLAGIAKKLSFGDFLLLSKGEKRTNGNTRTTILGDAMEAFLGALFLDQGLDACEKFITTYILSEIPAIIKKNAYRDAKSILQEFTQEKNQGIPLYKVIKTEGPDHDKRFTVAVLIQKKRIATGCGKSKQEAQQVAASAALAKLKGL